MADLVRRVVPALLLAPLFALLVGGGPVAQAAPASASSAVPAAMAPAAPAAPARCRARRPNPTRRPPSSAASPAPGTSGAVKSPGSVSVDLDPGVGKPSQTVSIILLLTVLSIAPALLLLCTAFTKIIVVLSLTRNALGLPHDPAEPGARRAGAVPHPVRHGAGAVADERPGAAALPERHRSASPRPTTPASKPLRDFMLKNTRKDELALMIQLSRRDRPAKPEDVPLTTLIPAFVLSELKTAFIIGFVIFIPFLVIDMVVSASLMSMGMMMLPPVLVSLPFKLLLFVHGRRLGADRHGPRGELPLMGRTTG